MLSVDAPRQEGGRMTVVIFYDVAGHHGHCENAGLREEAFLKCRLSHPPRLGIRCSALVPDVSQSNLDVVLEN